MRGLESRLGLSLAELARRTWRQIDEDDVLTYAGSLAFHGVLALFPLLILVVALLTFLDLTPLMDRILEWAARVLPREGLEQITRVLQEVSRSRDLDLLSLGAVGAIWAASGGVRSAMSALNQAYDVAEPRARWKRYALSLVYTLALAVLAVLAVGILLVGERIVEWVAHRVGGGDTLVWVWGWTRVPLATALLVLVTALVYSALPNGVRFRWLTPGAVLAVVLWIALSLAFRAYIESFGRYNVLYGSLGAVIVLLMYLWLSAIVLLVGGEVNAVIDQARADAGPRDRRDVGWDGG